MYKNRCLVEQENWSVFGTVPNDVDLKKQRYTNRNNIKVSNT